ncbi:DUF1381 domain-containing protein [Staphylococcus saprophyticus]|nr:DUF1381 domain-containing protein [Staphylococcus saprophyticus]
MTQYLIRTLTDSTGHPFTEVIKPRENEHYEIVSADSKEEARDKIKEDKEHIDISNICRYSNWF